MNDYFQLERNDQRRVLQQVAAHYGLPPQTVEKDLWVTTILQVVFTLPIADKLIFKGGTTLSKVWHLIERFSEDIDLAVDPSILGMEAEPTKKQLKELRKRSSLFVKGEFASQLQSAIERYGLSSHCSIEAEPDGEGDKTYPEPRALYVKYRSAYVEEADYLSPSVMLEIGARSLLEPKADVEIRSMVEEFAPTIQITLVNSKVSAAVAGKTFLEKAFLLHEMFSIEGHGARAERRSRHLYDLSQMMDREFALNAIRDDALWESIRHHRSVFTSVSGMDYGQDIRRNIVLVPRPEIMSAWEADYSSMSSVMIYGDKPTFAELMERMRELETRFHSL